MRRSGYRGRRSVPPASARSAADAEDTEHRGQHDARAGDHTARRGHSPHHPFAGPVFSSLFAGACHQEDRVVDAKSDQEQQREQRVLLSSPGKPNRWILAQPPNPSAANADSTVAAVSTSGATAARSRTQRTVSTTARITGITTSRSRAAASRTSSALASDPLPTRTDRQCGLKHAVPQRLRMPALIRARRR